MIFVVIVVLVISAIILTDSVETSKDQLPELTLTVSLFGEKPNGFDEVVKEAEERLRDTLNVSLNFEFTTPADYKNTLKMQLLAGRRIALAYDAPWMTNNELLSENMYYDLQDYFLNDDYPGLKRAFPKELIQSNLIDGHLYWIPIMGVEKDMVILYIREDLREKMGVSPVTDLASLRTYLDSVQENYPEMVPMDLGRKGFYEFFNDDAIKRNRVGIFEPFGTGNMELFWEAAISEDGRSCLGATTYGDPEEAFKDYPEGYQYDYYLERFQKFQEWNSYLVENSITITTASGYDSQNSFINGESAVCIGTLSRGSIEKELQSNIPEGKVSFFPLYEEERARKEGAVYTAHIANNFVGIPLTATEDQKERMILFLDWLFSADENYQLFRYGLEGRDYRIIDGEIAFDEAVNRYSFPYYELVWNKQYELPVYQLSDVLNEYQMYMNEESTYVDSPLSGFVYNSSEVKNELAAVNEEYSRIWFQLFHGSFEDAELLLATYHENAENLGLEKIRKDLVEQIQTFLNEKNMK